MFGFQSQRPVSSPQTVVSIVVDTGCHRTQRGRRRRDGNFYQINRGVSVPSTPADLTLSDRRGGCRRAPVDTRAGFWRA